LFVEHVPVGWVHPQDRFLFTNATHLFDCEADQTIHLRGGLSTASERTEALNLQLRQWHDAGHFDDWRNEHYHVGADLQAPPLFTVERSASSLLGLLNHGVHLNGFVRRGEELWLWVARRAWDRPRYPGKLDQLVAGGLTAFQTPREVLLRECHEEAGIPLELAERARPTGLVTLCHHNSRGRLRREVLFTFDLELPEAFVPRNQDGEVENFRLLPVAEVRRLVAETEEIKVNCNLVLLDFLVRHGELSPDQPGYTELVTGLRASPNPQLA
jgi:8-oxo-dGTP pyrophosphatase MutT (NUDIX family)